MEKYTLDIVSHHPETRGKTLKQYYVDGIKTVGAFGSEAFEIRFKNNTWQKVQVKLSLDGVDLLSGKLANTETNSDMWMCMPGGTLSIKAWPESQSGGAALVFTSANNSVAVHTTGDLSSRGIIAAAVFVEGHIEPVRIWNKNYYTLYGTLGDVTKGCSLNNTLEDARIDTNYSSNSLNMVDADTNIRECHEGPAAASASLDVDYERSTGTTKSLRRSKQVSEEKLKGLVSVGAGQHVDQKLSYVPALIKPLFTEAVRVRFLWWNDLVTKLKESNFAEPHASGFPGDKVKKVMSIGKTPRIGKKKHSQARTVPTYSRV
jgi:hypothetical protein